jgi:transposase
MMGVSRRGEGRRFVLVPLEPEENCDLGVNRHLRLLRPSRRAARGGYSSRVHASAAVGGRGLTMEVIHPVCCGLDVHKKSVAACLRRSGEKRGTREDIVRTFGTTMRELLLLLDWLTEAGCAHVAMESTGIYWRPVYEVLEGSVELLLVNPQHMKAVPGRKTDVRDCQWIARLLENGLLRGSFVPPPRIRELRELTRSRRQVIEERARQANRLQKILETANIKLGDVATDVLGVTGREILRALVAGRGNPKKLASFARGALRNKREQLAEALVCRFTEHHAFLVETVLNHVEFLEGQIAGFDRRIEEKTLPFAAELERLDTIPGVGRRSAEQILAEIGADMSRFPSARQLASWAAICPGSNESAGKRRTGRTRRGNRWLRSTLVECARAGSRKRDSYLAAQYRRLAPRRGDKRAIVALAHSILVAAWHILQHRVVYVDLGRNYFDDLDRERLVRYHRRRLTELGFDVNLEPKALAV